MKKSLYNINEDQQKLVEELIKSDGELTPEMEEQLVLNEKNRNQKAVAYMEVISSQKLKVSGVDSEIKRLQALKKREGKIIEKLEANLLSCVKAFGNFEVGTLKFGTRKSQVVEIDVEKKDKIPSEFKTSTTTVTISKTAIKDYLKIEGNKIEGCKLVTNLNLKIN
ncbi:hypothetical protein M1M25_gp032 [Tenacibaculum phage Gundel_1]|uniref:Siphovirus Gp157 n=1 Tax=Tenacibaculum phage Gundel_1 TaxID=2745672 RepID=A0A8E5EBK9_9CAUD|nr:hypothetical protein M1M25_gp032 [Tenacibaculum phage Gundel_1]QQV91464.1 hypothetical protein Gundel1_32 [Tenacibaculum phage Gundel_1]